MSINSTLGTGIAQVASNAILADSIARQTSALAQAHDSLDSMTMYASRLEGNVRQLHQIVVHDGVLIDALKAALDESQSERDQLAGKNRMLEERIARMVDNGRKRGEMYDHQVEYMRDLKNRLQQTEKALRQSSSQSVGLEELLNYLFQVTSAIENNTAIREKARGIRAQAYDQFMKSGQLTPDPEMQKTLDELKNKAPDFKPGVAN
jgi:polyhydroxyalkanoate synthesis regulator phasin